jgi:hypothetical protein
MLGEKRDYRGMGQRRRPMVAKLAHDVKRLQMKVAGDWPKKLDRWRGEQANPPNRSEAIRLLVEKAIDAECSTSRKEKS